MLTLDKKNDPAYNALGDEEGAVVIMEADTGENIGSGFKPSLIKQC
ncbi:MAG: hypothetical protein ACLRUZ_11660 [Faecalimonas sp.]